ncbi:MAG: PDDEXK nuclease domain-containing protein [Elusimicrobia bacterium]|nr:PDDEXK nuclease domain-containing protein [Elusimicrobiota bacterium]
MGQANLPAGQTPQKLLGDIRGLIESARSQVAQAANAGLVSLYWSVGRRVRQDILKEKRAGYGQRIVQTLSAHLAPEYGQGFSQRNLWWMIRFVEVFPDSKIVYALSTQLGWTHFRTIIPIKDPLKRDFYAEMCRIEHWNVPTLQKKVSDMLFERTALSRKPAQLAALELKKLREQDQFTPDLVFRDPVLLGFLGLKDTYHEKDLEAAILRELESFLVELGSDFAFVARQKRISVGSEDYYLDLLFFHRGMRRLVAIELKLGKFQAADKGQLELYLRWLDKHERRPGERSPIGLILCAESDAEHVELLQLEKSGIRVAQYMTGLPDRGLLKSKLHQAIRLTRQRLAAAPAAPHPPA